MKRTARPRSSALGLSRRWIPNPRGVWMRRCNPKTSSAPFEETYARFPRLIKALAALRTYIVHNRHVLPNYGERYHNGEAIATGFVESTVNEVVSKRFCKKQQMQWSKEGAHLLLQTRVKTLDGELGAIFKRWYPDMDLEVEESSVAA